MKKIAAGEDSPEETYKRQTCGEVNSWPSEEGCLIARSDGPEEILLLNILKCVGGLIHWKNLSTVCAEVESQLYIGKFHLIKIANIPMNINKGKLPVKVKDISTKVWP